MKIPLLISLQFFSRRFYRYRSTVHEIVSSTHRRQNYEIMYVEKRMHTIAYMMRTIIFTSKSVSYFSPHQKRREKKSFLIFLPLLVSLFRWLLDISMLEIFLIWIVHVFIANMRTVSHFLSPFFFSSFFLIGFLSLNRLA